MQKPNLKDTLNDKGVGVRLKNPGNRTGTSHFGKGTDNSSHHYTIFSDWTSGYAGCTELLLKYLDGRMSSKYGLGSRNPCMISVIYTWAPPDDGNDSAGYVKNMCRYCGIEPDDKIAITENNLFCMELAKGFIDSGCVQTQACRDGVKKALQYYVSQGGKLDSTDNLGKDTADVVQKIKSGQNITGDFSGGGGDGESLDSGGMGATSIQQPSPNAPRPIMASRGANTVYKLSSATPNVAKSIVTNKRREAFEKMAGDFSNGAPELGRDIIISQCGLGVELLKGQDAKTFRGDGKPSKK